MIHYEAGRSAGATVQSQRAVVVQYGPLVAFLVLVGLILLKKGKA